MNVTPCPMKTWSSIVTPSQMNVWLEILQRLPTFAFFWISTNAPILVSSPISQPYRLMNRASLTSFPSFTSGSDAQQDTSSESRSTSAGALSGDHGPRRGEQDLDVRPQRVRPGVAQVEAHHLVERRAAAAVDLPEPGDAGLGVEHAPAVPGLVLLDLGRQRRTRARPATCRRAARSRTAATRRGWSCGGTGPTGVTRGSFVSLNTSRPVRGCCPLDLMNQAM